MTELEFVDSPRSRTRPPRPTPVPRARRARCRLDEPPDLRALRDRLRQPASPTRRRSRSPSCPARPTTRSSSTARPGLGKTHLLARDRRATCARHHPELVVHYTTAERFTSEFVTALRRGAGTDAFKARYREARRAADRRRPVPRGQAADRGGVLPHLQRPPRRRQADRPLQRPAARRPSPDSPSGCATASPGASRSRSTRPTCAPGSRSSGASPRDRAGEPPEPDGPQRDRLPRARQRARARGGADPRPRLLLPPARAALDRDRPRRPRAEQARTDPAVRRRPPSSRSRTPSAPVTASARDDLLSPQARSPQSPAARQLAMYLARELTPTCRSPRSRAPSTATTPRSSTPSAPSSARLEPGSDTSGRAPPSPRRPRRDRRRRRPRSARRPLHPRPIHNLNTAFTAPPSRNPLISTTHPHRSDTSDPSRKMIDPQ